MLSSHYYQTRTEKNKTVWLIPNHCLPDHGAGCQLYLFGFRVKQPSRAPLLCPVEWSSTLCRYLFFFFFFLYHLHTVQLVAAKLICPLVYSQKKRTDKTKLWQECCRVVWCQCLRWVGNTRVHIWHDLFDFTKWKGHFTGIFLGPFQWDTDALSVKLSAVALTQVKNITSNTVSSAPQLRRLSFNKSSSHGVCLTYFFVWFGKLVLL